MKYKIGPQRTAPSVADAVETGRPAGWPLGTGCLVDPRRTRAVRVLHLETRGARQIGVADQTHVAGQVDGECVGLGGESDCGCAGQERDGDGGEALLPGLLVPGGEEVVHAGLAAGDDWPALEQCPAVLNCQAGPAERGDLAGWKQV